MPPIHPLSIPAYPGQGRRGCWSLSQHALGREAGIHPGQVTTHTIHSSLWAI
uniref:Uncharacterized protein n=1 Tax=Anguilla anguilla TaxID=7936 RepID=A0A0E9VMJ3_ANGAN